MLYAWKFRIRSNERRTLPSDPSLEFSGCFAIAIAQNADEAREKIRKAMNELGGDSRWLEPGCAEVIRVEITEPCCLGWAMS